MTDARILDAETLAENAYLALAYGHLPSVRVEKLLAHCTALAERVRTLEEELAIGRRLALQELANADIPYRNALRQWATNGRAARLPRRD